jgi:hypothetical protein
MARFYWSIGDLDKALAYSLKALSIRRNLFERSDHSLKPLSDVEEVKIRNLQSPVLKDLVLKFGRQITAESYLMTGNLYYEMGNQTEDGILAEKVTLITQ